MSILSNRPGASASETAAYLAGLRDLIEGHDLVGALTAFPARLADTVEQVVRDVDVRLAEAPGKWSVLQVIEHLADHEMIVGYRIRMILAHDNAEIQPFDQDLWADALHWQNRTVHESLADFVALRTRNLRLIRELSERELNKMGHHRERGPTRVVQLVELMAGHDVAHLRQIERVANAVRASR